MLAFLASQIVKKSKVNGLNLLEHIGDILHVYDYMKLASIHCLAPMVGLIKTLAQHDHKTYVK